MSIYVQIQENYIRSVVNSVKVWNSTFESLKVNYEPKLLKLTKLSLKLTKKYEHF